MWEAVLGEVARVVTAGALGSVKEVVTGALAGRRRQSEVAALLADRDGLARALAARAEEDPELVDTVRAALDEHRRNPRWSSPIYSILRRPFVDRDAERAAVREPGVHLVAGQRGVGKTGFVCQLGSELAGHFPHGPVYIDLDEYLPDNVNRCAAVNAAVLRQLGVEWVAENRVDAAEQYRQVTSRYTFLLILDNANGVADVTAHVPASPDSLTLVTTIRPGDDLVANYPSLISLDPLDHDSALRLLDGVAGEGTVAAEYEAAVALAERCHRLPLLLRLAAARVARRRRFGEPDPVASVERTYQRTGVLDAHGDDVAVRAATRAVDDAVAELSPDTVTLCARWAAAPVAELSEHALGVLADRRREDGAPAADVRAELDELRDAGMLVNTGGNQYRLFGTVAERIRARHPVDDTANERLLRAYSDAAIAFDGGERLRRYPRPERPPAFDFAGVRPIDWVDAERGRYAGLVRYAYQRGLDTEVCTLCGALEPLMLRRGHLHMFTELNGYGISCAQRLGETALLARLHNQQGRAYTLLGEFPRAGEALEQAWRLLPGLGDVALESSVLETFGRWYEEQEWFIRAGRSFGEAVRRDRTLGASGARGLGIHLRMGANVHVRAGDPAAALPLLDEAWRYTVDDGNRSRVVLVYAKAAYQVGDLDAALRHGQHAMELIAGQGTDQYAVELDELAGDIAHARAMRHPARSVERERQHDTAAFYWRRAGQPLWRAGHPKGGRFTDRLASIGRAPQPPGDQGAAGTRR